MFDSRLSPINFIGEDGFHWFIGQVAPAKSWKNEAKSGQMRRSGTYEKSNILNPENPENIW